MRIHRRKSFLKLPRGTVFCKGRKGLGYSFDEFSVKGDTWGESFGRRSLNVIDHNNPDHLFDRENEMLEHGASYPLNEDYGRDTSFDDDEVFLVYELEDLAELRHIVTSAILVAQVRVKNNDQPTLQTG